MLDKQEKKRADEWAAREARIQNAMGRMADTVMRKNNDAELELERRVVQYANERDRKAEEAEKRKKQAQRLRDMEIRQVLEKQLQEKRKRKEAEVENNRKYVQMVIDRDEQDKKDQKEKEKKTFIKLQEL